MERVKIEQIGYQLTWQIRHEVMYPDLPFDKIKLDNEQDGTHFGLSVNDHLTSVVSLFGVGHTYQFRKFATKITAQRGGHGSSLLRHLISYTKNRGGEQLWCNARVSAAGFYERFGFSKSGEVFTKDGIDFVKMELNLLA